MKSVVTVLLLAALSLFAQTNPNRYAASSGDVALSAQTYAYTLQQGASGGRQIKLESVTVYCSAACNVFQAQNGTAATTTAATVVPVQPNNATAVATAFGASNVGAGTTVGPLLHLTAAGTLVIDVSKVWFAKTAGSSTNYTVNLQSFTGTTNITYIWSEQ